MPGRNDPCPCGSGRKYKKCHQPLEQNETRPAVSPLHELDEELVRVLIGFARVRLGEPWQPIETELDAATHSMPIAQFTFPFALYHRPIGGRSIGQHFLQQRGWTLRSAMREWLEAQLRAWVSVWEVLEVDPGHSVSVKDLLTGEARDVQEVSGSRTLAARDALLARVVDCQGASVFAGIHAQPLPPREAFEVVKAFRKQAALGDPATADQMRSFEAAARLRRLWENAVEDFVERRSIPPRLQNTDGDDFVFTADHYRFDPERQKEIESRLAGLEGADSPPADHQRFFTFNRPGNPIHPSLESTIIGHATLEKGKLKLQTNSLQRADALKARVEAALGSLVYGHIREMTDPRALLEQTEDQPPRPESSPEVQQAVREMKQKHYESWLDQSIPALGGKTPRQAIRSRRGTEQLTILLKEIEQGEARLPVGERIDVSRLYEALGLPPP